MTVGVVSKSSPVQVVPDPAGPGGGGDVVVYLTSSFDRLMIPIGVTALLLFDAPIPTPAETIKTALSQALAHYSPVAGRLAATGDHIACTDELGVPFVAAVASCALADVTTLMLGELATRYPAKLCRHSEPLLLVQVTEFACGGFAVAATWNHVLADGQGMAQFLQAMGEFARGASPAPSVTPIRDDDGALPRMAMTVTPRRSVVVLDPMELEVLDVTVPSRLIDGVRSEFDAGRGDGPPCTTFEAVSAVLWQCRTRAAAVASASDDDDGGDDALVRLSFVCNVRGLVGARRGYYGNCVRIQSVTATRGAVANGAAADVARLIRRAKERIPELLLDGGGSEPAGDDDEAPVGTYDTLAVTSWRNLGFEAAEFGSGRPARVTWHGVPEQTRIPGCFVCPPGKTNGDGVSVMSRCVRPEHAEAFMAELARSAAS